MFRDYIHLMRLHKPIGIFLLLWPTLWALWLAGHGHPDSGIVVLFIAGVIIMRSAGCIINDIADRHIDRYVERTHQRPLATGALSTQQAFVLFSLLVLSAFLLALRLNRFTQILAVIGLGLAIVYPFLKRVTHLPQLGLGLAFAWGIPMAFAALTNTLPTSSWLVFLAAAVLAVIYDTQYALVDKTDDIKIGVRSIAILFGRHALFMISLLQILLLGLLIWMGSVFQLTIYYYLSVLIAALLFIYQYKLVKKHCYFQAFLNNQWIGLAIFLGIVL